VLAHTDKPRTWEAEQEDQGFKASLDYLVRPCLKTKTKTPIGNTSVKRIQTHYSETKMLVDFVSKL
jgi:hypothetical protein